MFTSLCDQFLGGVAESSHVVAKHVTAEHSEHLRSGAFNCQATRVVEVGPPTQIFKNPHNERTRSFLQRLLGRETSLRETLA